MWLNTCSTGALDAGTEGILFATAYTPRSLRLCIYQNMTQNMTMIMINRFLIASSKAVISIYVCMLWLTFTLDILEQSIMIIQLQNDKMITIIRMFIRDLTWSEGLRSLNKYHVLSF